MDKIKYSLRDLSFRDLSLRKSLILYVIFFLTAALVLSVMTTSLCEKAVHKIESAYPSTGEKYYLTNEQGQQLGEGTYIGRKSVPISEEDQRMIALLEMVPGVAIPVYSALCILASALLFYRNKLKKPLAELKAASEKISASDLDFSIGYDSKDELGQLCASFEMMRKTLANNFCEMWRQVEERKQLNAAFAHDLRTPLTVLKGYNEILKTSEESRTRETAATMGRHISRMEAYVNSMSNLRRMEDMKPEYKSVSLQPFLLSLSQSADILCTQNGKTLFLQNEAALSLLSLDSAFVSQVCSNLISNAVRYAKTTVTLSFAIQNDGLLLSVADDGNGFDESSLRKASDPYFTGEADRSEHFGLGLYICKLLCEHHHGYLKIGNTPDGARVSAFFGSPPKKQDK